MNVAVNDIVIPAASGIDYSDAVEMCGYQMLLCKAYERIGGLSSSRAADARTRRILDYGRIWLRETRRAIDGTLGYGNGTRCPVLGQIPGLLSAYDMLHRICNGEPCPEYLRDAGMKTVDKWLKGDKSVSTTDIVLMILCEVDRDVTAIERRYADYAIGMSGVWVDELIRHGGFTDIRLAEACRRLRYLLRADLSAYLGSKGQDGAKRHWADNHATVDHAMLDTATLGEYAAFVRTASALGYLSHEADVAAILSCLASRPDLHPFYRRAIELDLLQCQPV